MGSRSQGRAWGRTQTSYLAAAGSLQLSHHCQLPMSPPCASRVLGLGACRLVGEGSEVSHLAETPARDYISQPAAPGGGRACALGPVMER